MRCPGSDWHSVIHYGHLARLGMLLCEERAEEGPGQVVNAASGAEVGGYPVFPLWGILSVSSGVCSHYVATDLCWSWFGVG